jgi:hypothetical protein
MEYSGNVVGDTEVVESPHLDTVLVLSEVSSALHCIGLDFKVAAAAALPLRPHVSLQWWYGIDCSASLYLSWAVVTA